MESQLARNGTSGVVAEVGGVKAFLKQQNIGRKQPKLFDHEPKPGLVETFALPGVDGDNANLCFVCHDITGRRGLDLHDPTLYDCRGPAACARSADPEADLIRPPSNKKGSELEIRNLITPAGLIALKKEFNQLKNIERPKVASDVNWAAGNGDLSENGDYIYGKQRLA